MRTVAIVGSARTSRKLTPFNNPDLEIWGVNEALMFDWMPRASAMFQMHPRAVFSNERNSNHSGYWEWLQLQHDFPIYMLKKWKDVPSAVKYPFQKVIEELNPKRAYFTSTIAYMLALAIYQKYDRIELYGVEQGSDTEYFYQRDCVTYWLGFAEGRGVDLYLPEETPLLRAKLYGYEGALMISRSYFENRLKQLKALEQDAISDMERIGGRIAELSRMLDGNIGFNGDAAALDALLEKAVNEERVAIVKASGFAGARQECELYLTEYDALMKAAGQVALDTKEYALEEE